MSLAQLQEPVVMHFGASTSNHSTDSFHSVQEELFARQNEENPLEIQSNSSVQAAPSIISNASIQPTPSIMERQDPMGMMNAHHSEPDPDEPPPPYEEPSFEDAPQIAPVEYSCDNSPQLAVAPPPDWSELEHVEPPPRNPARLSGSDHYGSNSHPSPISPETPNDPTLIPRPLQIRSSSSNGSLTRRPVPSQSTGSTFSSAKAREAGFEIEPSSPRRTNSNSSIIIVPSTEPLRHTREAGKLTAYLIPLPKPRLKGIKPENIPNRFMVYTPPLPPLSKPAPGEKESQWHKTQRTWQEDVRKATISNASKATWKGMKAKTTILIGKGVNLTRSVNVEFLDRVSGGTITSTTETLERTGSVSSDPTSPASSLSPTRSASDSYSLSDCPRRPSSSASSDKDKDLKPKSLEDLTLIYPPSLDLTPESIRTEFVDSLLRTREKSRKDAIVASSLIPFAAGVDACLVATFGGLTQVSSVWAYTSIKGTITSKKVTQGLRAAEEQAQAAENGEEEEIEIRGCTCGNHEHEFGAVSQVRKSKGKKKQPTIGLRMQSNTHLEIFRRYVDLKCLKRDFALFPQIDDAAGDGDEDTILEAIGWQPTRRSGRDLEMEYEKGRIETLTPEQDEEWQRREAREDLKRICKKAASEWVGWCKGFQKEFAKDPVAAVRR